MKLKIGIILLLACAIGLALTFRGDPADAESAGDDSQTLWLCKACAHSFLLTARQVAQRADPDPHHWVPLLCPECRQKQAYLAMTCSTCRTIYFGRDVPGESGQCPRCAPAPRPATAEGDRRTVETTSNSGGSAAKPRPAAKVR